MTGDCLHGRVTDQVSRTPDAVAVAMGDVRLTYGGLEAKSNRLARAIREVGCEADDRVCLFLPKGPEAIVAMLATIKADCVYVPVDLESPAQRVAHVIRAAAPGLIIAHARARDLLSQLAGIVELPPVIALERGAFEQAGLHVAADFEAIASLDAAPLPGLFRSSGAAHILFTSGSTGLPKGVVITHRNVTAFLDWACNYFGIARGDRTSGHPPLHFDLSTFDVYGSLTRGAELHLVPAEVNLLAPKLAAFIRERELVQWFSVPSILTYLANFDVVEQGDFPSLRRLLWCGEVIPTATLIYWMERLPHVAFTNLYGPTEATIASSYYTVPARPVSELETIPIGQPCRGESLAVLDKALKPVPAGEVGELFIGGAGLSPGYWRDAEKTSRAFLDVESVDGQPSRMYRTGDLGRRSPDGVLHYLGRTDSQIKNRGNRIELGEIEVAINSLARLLEAAVVGVDVGGFEGTAICCAYVDEEAHRVSPQALRKELGSLVPRYMLPTQWLRFEALPKNANGKIDRPALRGKFAEQLARPNV